MKLGVSIKWDEEFGYDFSEIKLLNYLKKKNFVIYALDDFESISLEELIKIPIVMQGCQINILKLYQFQERTFCNINYSFLNFQKTSKKYYRYKINYYKNPKNLINRQIYGR